MSPVLERSNSRPLDFGALQLHTATLRLGSRIWLPRTSVSKQGSVGRPTIGIMSLGQTLNWGSPCYWQQGDSLASPPFWCAGAQFRHLASHFIATNPVHDAHPAAVSPLASLFTT